MSTNANALPRMSEFLQNSLITATNPKDDKCPVCQMDFQEDPSGIIRIAPCGHEFHRDCIEAWFGSIQEARNTCPTCRTTLFHRNVLTPEQQAARRAEQETRHAQMAGLDIEGYAALMRHIDELFEIQHTHGHDYLGIIADAAEWHQVELGGRHFSPDHVEQGHFWLHCSIVDRVHDHVHETGINRTTAGGIVCMFGGDLQNGFYDYVYSDARYQNAPSPEGLSVVLRDTRYNFQGWLNSRVPIPDPHAAEDGAGAAQNVQNLPQLRSPLEQPNSAPRANPPTRDAPRGESSQAGSSNPSTSRPLPPIPSQISPLLLAQNRGMSPQQANQVHDLRERLRTSYNIVAEASHVGRVVRTEYAYELFSADNIRMGIVAFAEGYEMVGDYAIFFRPT